MKINNKTKNSKLTFVWDKTKKDFETKHDDKNIAFVLPSKINDWQLLSRKLSYLFTNNNKKCLDIDCDSFIEKFEKQDQQFAVNLLLSKISNFFETSINLKKSQTNIEANIIFSAKYKNLMTEALVLAKAVYLSRYIQLTPRNLCGSTEFISFINSNLKKIHPNLKIKVLNAAELKKEKLELFLAVSHGANYDANLILIEFMNNSKNKKNTALVGKGILFDSGGYNIKTESHQLTMNQDMSGAASVFGTIFALASNDKKVNVVGVLPICDNMIGPKAMLCNDVYKTCDGQTVEITNTDAEGRLILADALAYASKKYKFDEMITVATLTGLSAITFGNLYTPYWSTSIEHKDFKKAGEKSGDYLQYLPLNQEYFDWVNQSSDIADYANHSLKNRTASNAYAAAFLERFSHCTKFTHFDIAGTNEFKKVGVNALSLMLYYFLINKCK